MSKFESVMKEARHKMNLLIDYHLIGCIEQIEGRVPTCSEMQRYGMRVIHSDGTQVYQWKGMDLVIVPKDFFDTKDGCINLHFRSRYHQEEVP